MFRSTVHSLVATALVAFALAAGNLQAIADNTSFDHRAAMQAATAALEKEHYTRRKLDDDLSAQWLAAFVAKLDPRCMYFLESDIADFQPFAHLLDDHAKAGDFRFPELVRSRYRERVASAVNDALELIDAMHDYSADESLPLQFDAYAKTTDELRERWRLRIKSELLIEKDHRRPLAEVQEQLRSRYERIGRQVRELTNVKLCEIYLDALARVYDSHSNYYADLIDDARFIRGLGITLRDRHGRYLIAEITPEGSHDGALSLIGWELIAIRGTSGVPIDLVEMLPRNRAFEIIRSPIGPLKSDTDVVLHPITLQRKSVAWTRFRY